MKLKEIIFKGFMEWVNVILMIVLILVLGMLLLVMASSVGNEIF